jgi:putative transposase
VNLTITAKFKILPTPEQQELLQQTLSAIKQSLNVVSGIMDITKQLSQAKLHQLTYNMLRAQCGLRSQMAQSVMKTVIAKYRSEQSNGHKWSRVTFKKPEYDLVWNRDYSLVKGVFSVNTLAGRVKVPFETKAMEEYLDGTWEFGTAKLIHKHSKFYLHIPMTKGIQDVDSKQIRNVIGVDMGVNFVATTYDSSNNTTFYNGRHIKHKRANYAKVRKELQARKTPSARRRLKSIGERENRWIHDINHCVSKALVQKAGKNSLIILEDLTGVRSATEKVRLKDRYVTVSWAFYQLRKMIEYKAARIGAQVIAVDPRYTSQTCPKCGHTEKSNRMKKIHTFKCQTCGYTSNDDRIGAMNLWRKGIEYIARETAE